jgi:Homeodomain
MSANDNRKSISSLLNPPSHDQDSAASSLRSPASASSRRYSAPPRSSFAEQESNQDDQPVKKAKRKRITPEQLVDLLALFEKTDTPSFEVREKLANQLNMTNREVQVGVWVYLQKVVFTLLMFCYALRAVGCDT